MKLFKSISLSTGLAIFAMLFGAGNLIFPIKVGITGADKMIFGLLSFLLTGVLIPLSGLFGIVLYNGNYKQFFMRLGTIPGQIFIFLCMLIIGPMLVMPRIVDFTYELVKPFLGYYVGILPFSLAFISLTFLCSYRRNSLIDLIGKVLSPLILILLIGIIAYGIFTGHGTGVSHQSLYNLIVKNLLLGYNTLDLLGAIFFGYIILEILKSQSNEHANNMKKLTHITAKASVIGGSLLALVYTGIAIIGSLHGHGFEQLNVGSMFSKTMIRLLGSHGALMITCTVFLACLTTIIALASVVSEYVSKNLFENNISYLTALGIVLSATTVLAQLELEKLMQYSEPLIFILYPAIMVLTFCNIAYKLWDFKPIKLPVLITLLISSYIYGPYFINILKNGPDIEKETDAFDDAFDFVSPIQQ